MGLSARIVSIAFLFFMTVFTLYQLALGNPFFEGVNPMLALPFFWLLAVVGVIIVFREKMPPREKKPKKNPVKEK